MNSEREGQVWVFDRPLMRDPAFVLGLAIGIIGVVVALVRDDVSWLARVLLAIVSLTTALVFVGIVVGSIREYRRVRRSKT